MGVDADMHEADRDVAAVAGPGEVVGREICGTCRQAPCLTQQSRSGDETRPTVYLGLLEPQWE